MAAPIIISWNGEKHNLANKNKFFLIAGPCVVENEKITFEIARKLKNISGELHIPFIFKASYKKANRTKGDSFRSIGVHKSLNILANVRAKLNLPVLTDIHSELEVSIASDFVDIIQIPAFLSRQTDLLEAAGESGKIVNIKKGQFLSPEDIGHQVRKIENTGNKKILITERGTTFGYNNLVVDMRSLAIMKKFNYPVIFDATHSLQLPSAAGGISGGNPDLILPMSRAAAGMGINGLFIETHINPSKALSDSHSMLPLNKIEQLLKQTLSIFRIVKSNS